MEAIYSAFALNNNSKWKGLIFLSNRYIFWHNLKRNRGWPLKKISTKIWIDQMHMAFWTLTSTISVRWDFMKPYLCWLAWPTIISVNLSITNFPILSATFWGSENWDKGTDVPVKNEFQWMWILYLCYVAYTKYMYKVDSS